MYVIKLNKMENNFIKNYKIWINQREMKRIQIKKMDKKIGV